jgi:ABC-type transport system substrate-binding protein
MKLTQSMCGFIAQTLLLLISTTNAQEHDYFGLKYAEPVIHAEALDPIYGRRAEDQIRMGEFIYSRLWRWNSRLNLEPDLCVSLPTITRDGKDGLSCSLRPDLKWPDGTPLTSDDIKFTIQVYRTSGKGYLKEACDNTEFNRIDDQNFELFPVGKATEFAFKTKLAFAKIQIFPKHILVDPYMTAQDSYVRRPQGSGPFQLESISKKGEKAELLFKRNPYSVEGSPKFKINEVKAVTEPSFSNQMSDIKTVNEMSYNEGDHKIDLLIEEISKQQLIYQLRSQGHLKHQKYARNSWTAIALNTRKNHLKSTAFRVQLDNAIDDKKIIKNLFPDAAKDITGPFIRDYGIYVDSLRDRHAPAGEIIEHLKKQGYILDKNNQLVWVDPSTGKNEKVEFRLIYNLDFVRSGSREEQALKHIIEQYKTLGIQIIKDGLKQSAFNEKMSDSTYWDMAFVRYTFGWDNNITPLFTFLNDTGYRNPLLLNELKIYENSREAAKKRSGERIHQHCYDNVPYLFLWHVDPEMYYRNIIDNITITPMTFFTSIGQWSVRPR